MKTHTPQQNRGFTLVEAMVAISILSLAITGPMIIAQKGIGSAIYARDQITASYLAQEAVEYVRNVRDTNRINGTSWLSPFTELSCLETGLGEKCQIDARYADFTAAGAIQACSGGTCPRLSYDTVNRLYGYGSGSDWRQTPFTRTIVLDNRASSKELKISVTVSWNTTLFAPTRTFTVQEYILNF